MSIVKPMRGESVKNIHKAGKQVILPAYVSSKIDGMRALINKDMPQTKQGYAIPNSHVRSLLSEPEFIGFDGELTAGDLYNQDLCAQTVSAVMSHDGRPEFCYWLFDDFSEPSLDAIRRHELLTRRFMYLAPKYPFLRLLDQRLVTTAEELAKAIEEMTITEGVMIKRLGARYKFGKATVNSQELVKYKPFEDEEAEVIGVIAGTTNTNAQTRNPLGGAKRSTAASGLVESDMAGAFRCRNSRWGDFNVSVIDMTHDERRQVLANAHEWLGRIITFKYLPVGSIDKPRSPTFKCIKDLRT